MSIPKHLTPTGLRLKLRLTRYVQYVVISIFIWTGVTVVPGAYFSGICNDPDYSNSKRLQSCSIALEVLNYSPERFDRHKNSGYLLLRGIILANMDDAEGAKQAMRTAFEWASFGEPRAILQELAHPTEPSPFIINPPKPGPWVPNLIDRVQQPDAIEHAAPIWDELVSEIMGHAE